jgi:hypothetical protein
VSGPFETERQAADAARHIYDSPPGTGAWGAGNHKLLEDACTSAGIQLGAYDHAILLWLAGWEPSTCAVVAGLITRAHRPELAEARAALLGTAATLDAGQLRTVLEALDVAADYKRDRVAACPDCYGDAPFCSTCESRLDQADNYDALAKTLRGPS